MVWGISFYEKEVKIALRGGREGEEGGGEDTGREG